MVELTSEEKSALIKSSDKLLTNAVYKMNVALKDGTLSTQEIIIGKYYALLLSELTGNQYNIKIDDFEAKFTIEIV